MKIPITISRALSRAKEAEPLEFGQILTRYVVGIVITVYVAASHVLEEMSPGTSRALIILLVFGWIAAIGFLVHLVLWPQRRLERRLASISADAIGLSSLLHFGEVSAGLFFPVYLWVILGNGFRFGLPYMYAAIAMNGVCFLIAALSTPYWREAWQFSLGLVLSLIAIPFYVSHLIRNLRQAMADAKAASQAKSQFLSMISHELRTPLNAILGLAEVSRLTSASAADRMNAESTRIAAGRLLRMVDSILKFQRIESGGTNVHERPFDPLEMLAEVRAIIEPLAHQKRLNFDVRFQTGLPESIRADADHIQTIILNLASNAVKYTQAGNIWLDIGLRDCKPGAAILRLEVRDTGPGIPADTQPLIFDQFFRNRPHDAPDEGGVGLGLSMCRSLAALLGGSLGCESEPGKGALFWVEIPVGLPSAPATAIYDASVHLRETVTRWEARISRDDIEDMQGTTPSGQALTILVADDNALNREVMKRMLSLDGHRVILVKSGEEALDHLLAGRIDAALIDVNMSDLDGIEMSKLYRAAAGGAAVPLVGVTADVSSHTLRRCKEAGMADVLPKPVTLGQLRSALVDVVKRPPGVSAPGSEDTNEADEEPILDAYQTAQLHELFGEAGFSTTFLPRFSADVHRNLANLREGISARRSETIRAALHAIKSSANTAGAIRLSRHAGRLENASLEVVSQSIADALDAEFKESFALLQKSRAIQ